jgi:hypothetical protein
MSGQWWRSVTQSALDQFNLGPADGGHLPASMVEEADAETFALPRASAARPTLIVKDRDGGRASSADRHGKPGRVRPDIGEVVSRFALPLVIHDLPADPRNGSAFGEGQ